MGRRLHDQRLPRRIERRNKTVRRRTILPSIGKMRFIKAVHIGMCIFNGLYHPLSQHLTLSWCIPTLTHALDVFLCSSLHCSHTLSFSPSPSLSLSLSLPLPLTLLGAHVGGDPKVDPPDRSTGTLRNRLFKGFIRGGRGGTCEPLCTHDVGCV